MTTDFWDWAVAAYSRPGVEGALLELQDAQGQSIPYLLWAAWMGADRSQASGETLREGARLAVAWDAQVVAPLRERRRNLSHTHAEDLRQQIKDAELDAEQQLMDRLGSLPRTEAPLGLAGALEAAAALWSPRASAEAMRDLAGRLS